MSEIHNMLYGALFQAIEITLSELDKTEEKQSYKNSPDDELLTINEIYIFINYSYLVIILFFYPKSK